MSVDKRTVAGILVLLLALVAILGSAGCIGGTVSDKDLPLANNGSWYNYDITNSPTFNTLQHTYDPKENFYSYANAENIKKGSKQDLLSFITSLMNIASSSSRAEEAIMNLNAQFDEVSQDSSLTGTEAELVRVVNRMYYDTETRNELGVTPILPAVEEIRKVSTLDELSALISSGGMSSLKEAFVREVAVGSLTDGSVTVLEISPQEFALIDCGLYQNMNSENARLYAYLMKNFHTFLEKCGYSSDEANATVSAFMDFEAALAPFCDNMSGMEMSTFDFMKYYHPYTYEQFSRMAFPIAGDLKVYHDAGVTRFTVSQPKWLDRLNELYQPENIEGFKAAMLYNLFMTSTPFLDEELQGMYFDNMIMEIYPLIPEIMEELVGGVVKSVGDMFGGLFQILNISSGNTSPLDSSSSLFADMGLENSSDEVMPAIAEMQAKNRITEEYIGMALGKVIVDKHVPASEKEKYTELTYDIIAAFKERLQKADWLSESTKAAALDKLSKVKVRVLYPDDWSYYSYADVNYKDAGTLYNLSVQLRKHNQAEIVKDALQAPSAAVWIKDSNHQYFLVPQVYNAFYNPADNSINILYGYVSGLIGNPDVSDEEILAVAGTTIAHELVHGFDPTGSRFDGVGSYVNWWTESDRKNFEEKEKNIADYLSSFEARPGEYLNGSRMTGEAISDFSGLSIALDIARDIDGFDYDNFFTVYGQGLYQPVMNALYDIYLADVHSPGMYRVNVAVQQYDEFLNTYNVTEGNQMYLAPENRLTIW